LTPKDLPSTAATEEAVEGKMPGDSDEGVGAFIENCTPDTEP